MHSKPPKSHSTMNFWTGQIQCTSFHFEKNEKVNEAFMGRGRQGESTFQTTWWDKWYGELEQWLQPGMGTRYWFLTPNSIGYHILTWSTHALFDNKFQAVMRIQPPKMAQLNRPWNIWNIYHRTNTFPLVYIRWSILICVAHISKCILLFCQKCAPSLRSSGNTIPMMQLSRAWCWILRRRYCPKRSSLRYCPTCQTGRRRTS